MPCPTPQSSKSILTFSQDSSAKHGVYRCEPNNARKRCYATDDKGHGKQ